MRGPLRYRVIANPSAGLSGRLPITPANIDELRAVLARHGLGADVVEPHDEASARAAIREAIEDDVDVIVAAGGDGTVHLVADALVGTDRVMGILPMGRVMNVARALGIGRDLDTAAEILAGATCGSSTSVRRSLPTGARCISSRQGPSASTRRSSVR